MNSTNFAYTAHNLKIHNNIGFYFFWDETWMDQQTSAADYAIRTAVFSSHERNE